MEISFRQLELFCEIVKKGNVSRAAEELDISQSAASMSLGELEKQFQQKLFDRFGKKLVLNSNGRALLPKALEILSRVGEIQKLFPENSRDFQEEISLGASSTIGNYIIPEILGKISQKYPKLQVKLKVGNTEQIIDALKNFEIDFAYIEGFCKDPAVESSIWKRDQLAVFSNPLNPLTQKEVTLKDLEESNWILREKGSGTREIFEKAILDKISHLNISYELGHTEAVKNGVKSGLGISCLSTRAIEEELKNRTLHLIPTPFLQLERNFYLLMLKGKYITTPIKRFINFPEETF